MFDRNPFEDFDFRRRRSPAQRLVLIEAVALGIFLLLWWLCPPTVMLLLLVPSLAALIWAASLGWRQALSRLIEFLQTIEDRFGGF